METMGLIYIDDKFSLESFLRAMNDLRDFYMMQNKNKRLAPV